MSIQLRPGYKQTELGVIPDEWCISSIQDLLDRGVIVGHLDGNHGELYPRSDEFKESGVPYITANDLCGHRVSFKNCKFLSKERAGRFRKGVARSGDVLFAHNATVGPTALLKTDLDYVILSTTATYFRCDQEKLLNSFLLYAIQSSPFIAQYRAVMAQSTRNQVPITAQRKLSIATPSTKTEQEAIAGVLSDADALIESLEQLLTKKRHLKNGAMQELLTPKEGWVDKNLGRTATLKARIGWQGLTTAEYLETGDFYLVTGTDFKGGYIDWDHCSFVEESRYKQDKNIQLRKHDVLVTKDGTIGKVALVNHIDIPATLNSGVFVIRPIENAFHPEFFYYLLCSNLFAVFLAQLSAGSTINHLYQKDFVSFNYKTPSTIAEQTAIASILSDMDAEIVELETQLTKTRFLKQGMMHRLLTGEIRLI